MVQSNSWLFGEPDNWDSYLPRPADYETAGDYRDAMQASAEDTTAPVGQYWDPIGQVNRGGQRTEQEIGVSRFQNFGMGKDQASIRLANLIANSPDMARAAYYAHDEYGNSLIDPAILNMIERTLGIGANKPPPVEGGVGSAGNWTNPNPPVVGTGENPWGPPDHAGGEGGWRNPNRPMLGRGENPWGPPDHAGGEGGRPSGPTSGDGWASNDGQRFANTDGWIATLDPQRGEWVYESAQELDPWYGQRLTDDQYRVHVLDEQPAAESARLNGSGTPVLPRQDVGPLGNPGNQPATFTIDPRYPDYILQGRSRGRGVANRLGGY